MTRFKATCGCKWSLASDAVITPTEVVRAAQAHAEERNHSVILEGMIERPRKKEWIRPIEHERSNRVYADRNRSIR
jgi:hypothetical protein